jgi:hypothetical protein
MAEENVVDAPVEKQVQNVVTSENSAEFYAGKIGLANNADEPMAGEPEPGSDESKSEPAAEDKATATDVPKTEKVKMRFDKVSRERDSAIQEAAKEREARLALEERIRALEGKPAQTEAPVFSQKPNPDDFKDAFAYAEALSKWSAEDALARRDQEERQRREAEQQDKVMKAWSSKVEKVIDELPDYENIVASSSVQVNDAVRDAILESDVGPQILYELASNDELAERITNMSTASALRELGKLEARFEAKPEPKGKTVVAQSKAPEPINPLRGSGGFAGATTEVEKMSFQQYRAARKAGKIR